MCLENDARASHKDYTSLICLKRLLSALAKIQSEAVHLSIPKVKFKATNIAQN